MQAAWIPTYLTESKREKKDKAKEVEGGGWKEERGRRKEEWRIEKTKTKRDEKIRADGVLDLPAHDPARRRGEGGQLNGEWPVISVSIREGERGGRIGEWEGGDRREDVREREKRRREDTLQVG